MNLPLAPVDEFPCAPADEGSAIQTLIASDMENAERLLTAFETDPNHGSVPWQMRNRPREKNLYPNLTAMEARGWLMPLLRRLRWNAAKQSRWAEILSDMIGLALRKTPQLSEVEFTSLAEAMAEVHEQSRGLCLRELARHIEALERGGDTSDGVIRGIRALRQQDRADFPHKIAWVDPFLWPLFRVNGILPREAPWAVEMRADIGKLDVVLLPIFEAESTLIREPRLTSRARAALDQIGAERLEAALRRWVGMLKEAPPLSEIDTAMLGQVILLIDTLPAYAAEALLWEIVRAPWRRREDAGWVKTYVWVINRYVARGRSANRAFACVEALAMNKATATEEVLEIYHSILSTLRAEGTEKGVDGFPFDCDSALAKVQRRVDQVLRICAEAVARGPYVAPEVALLGQLIEGMDPEEKSMPVRVWQAQMIRPRPYFDPGPEVRADLEAAEASIYKDVSPLDLLYASFSRLDWIAAHENAFSEELLKAWRQQLAPWGMIRWALQRLDRLPLPLLVRTLRSVPGEPHTIELCRRHVAEHGWDKELVDAMRAWVRALETSATVNLDRAKVEWFLWFEDACPIQVEGCWSYRVKQDLRRMKPKQRAAWLKLLDNPSFTVTAKPPQKWLKAARASFPGVGAEEFRRRFVEWFEPFGEGAPLRLTVCGRNMLRGLMWLALVAEDSAVDEALCRFGRARWKTKEHLRRAAQAEMAFAHVLAERAPEGAVRMLEKMLASGRAGAGSATNKALHALRGCSDLDGVADGQLDRKPKL